MTETNDITVLRMKTLFQMRPLFAIVTIAGIMSLILYQFYVITGPRQVIIESTQNRSYKVPNEMAKTNSSRHNDIEINFDESNKKLNQVKNNIFNITQEIEEIKKKLKYYDKVMNTTKKDVDVVSEYSKNVTVKAKYLLTIFTTWTMSEDTYNISKNTLKNWASFKPIFNPVLFTNDSALVKDAKAYGWTVLPLMKLAENGLPILKYMYMDAINAFKSTFYCYANSDMLFEDGLVKTLVNLEYTLGSGYLESKPVLVTGLRWNVVNVREDEITPRENIKTLIAQRGKVFVTSAEDYFITNRIYPWRDIQEVVVGAVAYDNWLVANAREKKHLTINTSRTIPALHQSADNNNHRSHGRDTANYNADLLKNVYKINLPYHKGFLDCVERYTDFVNDTFILGDRMVSQYCN